jgi:hypothetical protein
MTGITTRSAFLKPCVWIAVSILAFLHLPARCQTWTKTSASSNYWTSIACSADGTKLVALNNLSGGGTYPVFTSTNSGLTWTSNHVALMTWNSVASSADGKKLVAGALGGGSIYTSTNSGITWINTGSPFKSYRRVVSSADGNKLMALADQVYLSTNSGAAWNTVGLGSFSWYCAASSADGNTLLVGRADSSFRVHTSTDAGVTWNTNTLLFYCVAAACSADGAKMFVACLGNKIYTSTNSGFTWNTNSTAPNKSWQSLASSADGTRLVAAVDNGTPGEIYTSSDSGATWTSNNVALQYWNFVASSADGGTLVAAAANLGTAPGPIYSSQTALPRELHIATANSNVLLSWIIPSSPFVLQQKSDLQAGNWLTISNAPSLDLSNLQNVTAVSVSNGATFFRLSSP